MYDPGTSLASPGVIFEGMLIYDSVWCQYEIFTLPPPPTSLSLPRNFFFLFPANAHFAVPCVWHRGRCASPLCATSGESLRRVFHLTVARLPPDASHLRHTAPASFRTICLLIDLSLVGSALWILWGEKYILTDFLHAIVFQREKRGTWREDILSTWR